MTEGTGTPPPEGPATVPPVTQLPPPHHWRPEMVIRTLMMNMDRYEMVNVLTRDKEGRYATLTTGTNLLDDAMILLAAVKLSNPPPLPPPPPPPAPLVAGT